MGQEDDNQPDGQSVVWVQNKNPKTNKTTSKWHMMHSYRMEHITREWVSERTASSYGHWVPVDKWVGFALTMCGDRYYNPKGRYSAKGTCDRCSSVAKAISATTELPREQLAIE